MCHEINPIRKVKIFVSFLSFIPSMTNVIHITYVDIAQVVSSYYLFLWHKGKKERMNNTTHNWLLPYVYDLMTIFGNITEHDILII